MPSWREEADSVKGKVGLPTVHHRAARYGGHPSPAGKLAWLAIRSSPEGRAKDGGPDRDRTGDLLNAIQARSQLRYRPFRCETNPHCNEETNQRPSLRGVCVRSTATRTRLTSFAEIGPSDVRFRLVVMVAVANGRGRATWTHTM
jgi:hypothetical protein